MPKTTTDADLEKLPAVPFPFELILAETRVTDVGLKNLRPTGYHDAARTGTN